MYSRRRTSALLAAGTIAASVLLSATPANATATGCTGNPGATDGSGIVCLTVKGSKLHVDSVKLEKQSNNGDWKDYGIISIGSPVTFEVQGPTISVDRTVNATLSDTVNESFPNNTKACGWWHKYPNVKACITIHS